MKYSKFMFCTLVLSSSLVITLPLAANAESQAGDKVDHSDKQPFPNEWNSRHHEGHGKGAFHFPPEVNLTENQRDQIFSIKHKQAALLYEQSKIVRTAHIDLHKLVTSDQFEDDKAKAITDKLGKALGNIKYLRVQEMHQIYALLTPEQRSLLNSHQFNRKERNSKHPISDSDKPVIPPHP